MSYLRAHPRRAIAVALALALIIAAFIVVPLTRGGGDLPPVATVDRATAVASLAALQPADLPKGARTSDAAIDAAAKYEWALARLSERARDSGIPAPTQTDLQRELKAYARACCGGNVDEVVRRARAAGASRADLDRAVALRIDYGRLQQALVKERDPAPAESVAKEIARLPERYTRQPKAREVTLYMCMTRACAKGVISALDAGKSQKQIAADITAQDPRNGVVAGSNVGPAGDLALWRAVEKLPVGTWPREPVQTELAPWVIPVPQTAYQVGEAIKSDAQRHIADLALRNDAVSAELRTQIEDLIRQVG